MRHTELVAELIALGWVDSSYGNDASPSMGYGLDAESGEWVARLFIADADYDEREEEGEPRYTLVSEPVSSATDSAMEVWQDVKLNGLGVGL